jgi:hypothetical protein
MPHQFPIMILDTSSIFGFDQLIDDIAHITPLVDASPLDKGQRKFPNELVSM